MAQHPVFDAVAELIRVQTMRIEVTPEVSYTVRAPCLLAQLADALGASDGGSGGRTVARSRLPIATDAWDLWHAIVYDTHAWAVHLGIDRRRYTEAPVQRRAVDPPAPWWTAATPAPDAPALQPPSPRRLAAVPTEHREPAGKPATPPVGKLLRAVAAEAVSRGQEAVADRVHDNARRWARQITALLTGQVEQRAVRGAGCPVCVTVQPYPRRMIGPWAGPQPTRTIVEYRDEAGRQVPYRVPAIVLVVRDDFGMTLRWLVCRACGWSAAATEDGTLYEDPAALSADLCPCCCHTGGAFRPACDITGGCGTVGCDGTGRITQVAA